MPKALGESWNPVQLGLVQQVALTRIEVELQAKAVAKRTRQERGFGLI